MLRSRLKQILVSHKSRQQKTTCLLRALDVKDNAWRSTSNGSLGKINSQGTQNETKPLSEMPGPLSLPVVGTLYKYLPFGEYSFTEATETCKKIYMKYGKIVHEEVVPGTSAVYLYDADDIEALFRQEGKYPNRFVLPGVSKIREDRKLPDSIANLVGKEWHTCRFHVQKEMMQPTSASMYIPRMDGVAQDFVKRMARLRDENGEIDNFMNELYKWTLESIGVVAFDKRLGTLGDDLPVDSEASKLISAVHRSFEGVYWTTVLWNIYRKRPHLKTFKNLYEDMDTLWAFFKRSLREVQRSAATDQPSLVLNNQSLSLSLLSKDGLQEEDAIALIADLFTGAIDTTAHSTAFILYHLAMNQECQITLQKEIDTLAPPGTDITHALLQGMKYLKAVTKESIRLSPIAPYNTRILDHDIILSGYKIPAGVQLRTANSVTSQLEKYFDDPNEFKPDRWLKNRGSKDIKQHPFAYVPFGYGPRMCIGKRFAEQEMWLALIKIFQQFNVEYHHEPFGSVCRLTNKPDKPLRFSFRDRT